MNVILANHFSGIDLIHMIKESVMHRRRDDLAERAQGFLAWAFLVCDTATPILTDRNTGEGMGISRSLKRRGCFHLIFK